MANAYESARKRSAETSLGVSSFKGASPRTPISTTPISGLAGFNRHIVEHVSAGDYHPRVVDDIYKHVSKSNKALEKAMTKGSGGGAAIAHGEATFHAENAAKQVAVESVRSTPEGRHSVASPEIANAAYMGTLNKAHTRFVDSLPENKRNYGYSAGER